MSKIELASKVSGKRSAKVVLEFEEFLHLRVCLNGYQTTGIPVDRELLVLIRDAIDEYLGKEDVR